ncbi:hypothetical protein M9H77_36167 [Catharanthus roseus]|uniref:Uncharacterized protein n=1 Tax=Catharanthus roseus TaxID=4058 RepID=A0ACB9ZVA9_CATRO|nr:hypothetical protein M9H77_36167 [Catharanthus roseus]
MSAIGHLCFVDKCQGHFSSTANVKLTYRVTHIHDLLSTMSTSKESRLCLGSLNVYKKDQRRVLMLTAIKEWFSMTNVDLLGNSEISCLHFLALFCAILLEKRDVSIPKKLNWFNFKSTFEEESFYGFTSFYKKSIKDLNTIASLLVDLPKKMPDQGKASKLFSICPISKDHSREQKHPTANASHVSTVAIRNGTYHLYRDIVNQLKLYAYTIYKDMCNLVTKIRTQRKRCAFSKTTLPFSRNMVSKPKKSFFKRRPKNDERPMVAFKRILSLRWKEKEKLAMTLLRAVGYPTVRSKSRFMPAKVMD